MTEVVFYWQAIFVAADYEHEIFQRLPFFRSYLRMTLAIDIFTSLYLFCVFLDGRDSASYDMMSLVCIRLFASSVGPHTYFPSS